MEVMLHLKVNSNTKQVDLYILLYVYKISTALCNDFQADSTDLFSFLIEPSIPKL